MIIIGGIGMPQHSILRASLLIALVFAIGIVAILPGSAIAITVGQIDDFTSGDAMGWLGAGPVNVADPQPAEVGDRAILKQAFGGGGSGSRLIMYNFSQWGGDWTAAGVQRISMDLLNPNASQSLTIRLGISGPGSPGPDNSGPTYGSLQSFALPADNQWHQFTFDVSPASWINLGGANVSAALASVNQFRILHSVLPSINGDPIAASFLVDNITALGAASVDGDYNGNLVVDAADYTLWRDSLGQMGASLPADGNGDEKVDTGDYAYWKARLGNNSPSETTATTGSLPLPEPAAASIALMLLMVVGLWRWFDLHAGEKLN